MRHSLRLPLASAAIAALVLLVAAPASAAPRSVPATDALYLVTCDSVGGTEVLFSVDSASGASTQIGTGIGGDTGCAGQPAYNPITGKAYYFDFFPDARLMTIDLTTGVSTPVGQFLAGVTQIDVDAIAIGLDGAAYAVSEGTLYTLDLGTGALTAPLATQADLFGLAVDPTTGLFYGVTDDGKVYSIVVATGVATLIDDLTFTPGENVLSLQIDSDGTFWYLNSIDPAALWSSDGVAFAGTEELSGVTHVAGTATNVFSEALLIAPAPVVAVPEGPALAATGIDATATSLLGAGAALIVLLGTVLITARRQRATR